MPPKGRHKKLVVANKPRPPGASEALWRSVEEMARIGNARDMGREGLAKAAGVSIPQASKWLSRTNTPDFSSVGRFEESQGLEPGSLTRLPGELGKKVTPQAVLGAALALGLDRSVLDALAGKTVAEMAELAENMKRAVLGAVHVLGYSLEAAAKAGREAQLQHPGLQLDPETWLAILRPILAKYGPPGSGTFPSSGKIKLG